MRARWRPAALAALIFVLNLWIAKDLLLTEYVDQMGSIESTHITLTRWILEHWPRLTWFPLWYGGVPFQNAYNPLHHLCAAALAWLLGVSPALAYHAFTAVSYALGPATLFWLALRLSRSHWRALSAGVLYSLVSPSAFLFPAVRWDVSGVWHPRRYQALVKYGEGPHILSMTLLAAALVLLTLAFEKRRPGYWFLASLGLASVVLTNWLGAFALAVGALALLLSDDRLTDWRRWAAAAACAAFAYALSCCWIPPSTIASVFANEANHDPLSFGAKAVALSTLAFLAGAPFVFRRFKVPRAARFSILFLVPLAAFVAPFHWARITLMGQGHRLHLELDMAIALAAVSIAAPLLTRWPRLRAVTVIALVPVLVVAAARYRKYAWRISRPADVSQTVEYRHARWYAENMAGRRVMPPGSIAFWLNVWNDTPQFGGGFYQAVTHQAFPHIEYQLFSGANAGAREAEVAVHWLRAYGVDAVEVSGPQSPEFYKPFANAGKFEGVLAVLWRDSGNTVYAVPRRSRSLAHVVRPLDVPPRLPEHGLDLASSEAYVRALEDPSLPAASFNWLAPDRARISAALQPGQLVSVQISYHPGWRASLNGKPRPLRGDGLGQIILDPRCSGACTLELVYDGGREMAIARAVSWTALLAGLAAAAVPLFRRRRAAA